MMQGSGQSLEEHRKEKYKVDHGEIRLWNIDLNVLYLQYTDTLIPTNLLIKNSFKCLVSIMYR